MLVASYPDDLKFATWEKKKGSLPPDGDLPEKLKALLKLHGNVKWSPFEDGWTTSAKTRAELDEAFAERDRLFRGSVFPLKKVAVEIASLAQRQAKEKGAADLVVKSCKAIAAAANEFADAVDAGVEGLKAAYEKAQRALPEVEEGADEPPALLLDPRKLAGQLVLCRKDKTRKVQFAYVDGKDKQPAVLAMSPKTASRTLFSKVSDATGVKTGAHGTAWIDDATLYLQMEKPLGGLAKKVRAPLKDCGFKVTNIVLWDDKGQQTESDAEPETPVQGGPGSTVKATSETTPETGSESGSETTTTQEPKPQTPDDLARPAFTLLLQTLEARYAKALESAPEPVGKLGPLLEFGRKQGAAGEYVKGLAGLKKLGEMLLAALGKEEAEWETLREQSDAKLRAAQRQMPGAAGKLRALLDLADKRAGERKFDAAVQALQQMDKLVEALGPQRDKEAALLREEFKRWQKDPAEIDESSQRNLAALRADIVSALDGDVELARVLIDMLGNEWAAAEKAAQEFKKEQLAALEQSLREIVDPPGLDLLEKNPLPDARKAVRGALDRGAVAEAGDALERLRQVLEQTVEAIAEATRRRLEAFQDALEKLADPPGSEEGERQVLEPLRTEAQRLILADTLAPIPAALKALADAVENARQAIEQRLVAALQALQQAFDKVVLPQGATTEELAPAEAPRLLVVAALKDRQPGPGQQALREYVLALRKVARAVARRLKADSPPDAIVDDPAIEQGRERARQLRDWIETNVYIPNATIKTETGALVDTADADDAFDLDTIDEGAYAKLLEKLGVGAKKRIEDTQARMLLLAEPRKQLDARAKALAQALKRCEAIKTMAAPTVLKGWVAPNMQKVAYTPAGQHELALRAAAGNVTSALSGLSSDVTKDDGVAAAQVVLLSSATTLASFDSWRKTLARDDSPDAAAALLECARVAVDAGLRVKGAQGRYNAAKQNRMAVIALKAQLDADYEQQAVIEVADQLKVLGKAGRFTALPAYEGIAMHLSLFDGVYKGGQSWPKGTAQDPNDLARRNRILDALIGKERSGIHVTLEWTGMRDNESNLKCYRAKGGTSTEVMWNGKAWDYTNFAAGKTAAQIVPYRDFGNAPDIGKAYPSEKDAATKLTDTLVAIVAAMRTRIEEMCNNRGMTNEEKTANTRDKVKDEEPK